MVAATLTRLAAVRANRLGGTGERLLIGGHELGRAGQTGKANAGKTRAAEIMKGRAGLAIDKRLNVTQSNWTHRLTCFPFGGFGFGFVCNSSVARVPLLLGRVLDVGDFELADG